MPARSSACLILLLAASALAAPEAEPDPLAAVRAWQEETLLDLADRALAAGHPVLALRCDLYREMAGFDVTVRPEGEEDPKLSDRKRAKLEAELSDYRSEAALRLAAAGAPEEAVRLDPSCATAQEGLGRVRAGDWGWVDGETAAQLKKGLLPTPDGWVTKAEARKPGTFVVVTSPHWRIRSRLPLRRTFELRDLLEALHRKWRDDWEGAVPLVLPDEPHEVIVFEEQAPYEAFLSETDPRRIGGVPGQYSPNLKRAVFYDVESHRTGSNRTSSMVELMLHECTHQLVHEEIRGKFQALEGADAPNFWLHEGIAEYYGMHTAKKGALVFDRRAVAKQLRTPWLAERKSKTLSLDELDTATRGSFLVADGEQRLVNYAHAGFVAAFLAEGGHAPSFRRIVRAFYCEGNPPAVLATHVTEDLARLDRAFRTWFRRIS